MQMQRAAGARPLPTPMQYGLMVYNKSHVLVEPDRMKYPRFFCSSPPLCSVASNVHTLEWRKRIRDIQGPATVKVRKDKKLRLCFHLSPNGEDTSSGFIFQSGPCFYFFFCVKGKHPPIQRTWIPPLFIPCKRSLFLVHNRRGPCDAVVVLTSYYFSSCIIMVYREVFFLFVCVVDGRAIM